MHGASFAPVLFDAGAPSPRAEQYYECWSNRAYYRDGWLARSIQKRGAPIDLDNWTLHHLDAGLLRERGRAVRSIRRSSQELIDAFDAAAWKYFVYPLDNRDRRDKFADVAAGTPQRRRTGRARFCPGAQTMHRADVLPLIADRSFRIRVRFAHRAGDDGVLWAIGDPIGGMVMYVEDDRLQLPLQRVRRRDRAAGVRAARGRARGDARVRGARQARRQRPDPARRRRGRRLDEAGADAGALRHLRRPRRRPGPARPGAVGRSTSATAPSPTRDRSATCSIEPGARAGIDSWRRDLNLQIARHRRALRRARRRPAFGQADGYPAKPIRVIVPTVAGGALDNVARLVARAWASASASRSWSRTAAAPPA